MCEIDWEILHKYVDSFIWPTFLIVILLIFKRQVNRLINRITNESEKIEIPGVFTVTLNNVNLIKKKTKESGEEPSKEIRQLISSTVVTQIEVIKELGEKYPDSSFDQRRILENRIKEFAVGLDVDDIESLFGSKNIGHRIAAAMVLESIFINKDIDPFENDKVKDFLTKCLDSRSSFLRYEALQVILLSDKASSELNDKLNSMKSSDKSIAIRSTLSIFLKRKTDHNKGE